MTSALFVAGLVSRASTAEAAVEPVDLGAAASYSVLAGLSVTNTGTATDISGDLGVSPGTSIVGFPPGIVRGEKHAGDTASAQAHDALVLAYDDAASRTPTALISGDLGTTMPTITPGVYRAGAAIANTGTVRLDALGDPDAVFIFQVGAAFNTAAGSVFLRVNQAQAKNIFWQVLGAAGLGANSIFTGNIMAFGAVTVGDSATVNGRVMAIPSAAAVTLANNVFTAPAPTIVINGGPAVATNDATPTISGTSNAAVGSTVTVSVAGQSLNTTVQAGGTWTVTAGTMVDVTYDVRASVTAADGNIGSANQALTIDTSPPIVTITGGSTSTTNDPTPTISGSADAPVGSPVTVTVAGQTLSTTVQSGGTWSVTASTVADGTYDIVASVIEPAGNTGSATQSLTVDTTAPTVTITGGATRTTNDSTPAISGTTDAAAGTAVTVTVAGQSLTTTVQSGGTWTVTATTVAEGTHVVVASVTDPAGNVGTANQSLTVDTVAPAVAIDGGAAATSTDSTPTISGTTDAEVGSAVTVTIAGQTLTTTVQTGGTWSVTVTVATVTDDTYDVVASTTDAAGNTGTAIQSLTVDTRAPEVAITGGASESTNDATPTISGATDAPVGTPMTVTLAGQTLTTTTQSGGTWTVTVTAAAIADGTYTVLVVVTDGAGNTGTASQALTIDTIAPVVSIAGGATASTADGTPTISGTTNAPVGTLLTVTIAGQSLTTPVQSDGSWAVNSATVADGTYPVVVQVSDLAGNTGSATQSLTVDSTAPLVTITGGAIDVTNESAPTISGTATAAIGTTVAVTFAGQILTTTVQGNGTWAITTAAEADGTYTVRAEVTDPAGNTGTATQSLTIDTIGPVVTINGGAALSTNDSTPTISGRTDAPTGSPVTVTISGQTLTTTVQSGGTWTVTAETLPEGSYSVSVLITDPAGNTGSATQSLTVDISPPTVTITGGAASATNDSTPTITGTSDAPAGSAVQVSVDGQQLSTTVQAGGTWSVTAATIPEGMHTVRTSVTDQAGNTGRATQLLTVDTATPVVTITGGAAASTNDSTPTISGTSDAPSDSTVTVTVDAQTLTTTVQPGGSWSVIAANVPEGTHTVLAAVTDAAGNTGTATQLLTLDSTAPVVSINGGPAATTNESTPTIAGTTDAPLGSPVTVSIAGQTLTTTVQGGGTWSVTLTAAPIVDGTYTVLVSVRDAAGNAGIATQVLTVDTATPVVTITGGTTAATNDSTPTISGTTDAVVGTTVTVTYAGQIMTTTVQSAGTWSVTAAPVANGTFTVLASVTDTAGNTGSATQALTVDTIAPTVSITGGLAVSTNDETPTIAGTSDAPVGTTVTVTVARQTLTTTVQSGGTWSITAATLTDGTYDVTASVTDPAGNTGSATQALTVDTVLPTILIAGGATQSTGDPRPTIAGTTDAPVGSRVAVAVAGQSLTTTVQSGGTWSITAATLTDGTYDVTASVTDPAGNTGSATQALTVDTSLPVVVITGGPAVSTNDSTPTIAGTTDAAIGSTLTVTLDGQILTTTVQSDGSWAVTVTAGALADGPHEVLASVTDSGGTGTATQTVTVDTSTPTIDITGGATASTNDSTPTIAGTTGDAALGSTVTVTIAGQSFTTTVQSNGTWSLSTASLADGIYDVAASVTDTGGTGTATQILTVDTTTPVVTITGGASASTNDATPTISGTTDAAAGTTLTVSIAGQLLTTPALGGGAWTVTVTAPPVADATYSVLASVTDAAGNTGTATQALTVDTVAPTVIIAGGASTLTNDSTPAVSGTTDAAVGTTVTVTVDGQSLSTFVQVGGTWSVTAATLAAGTYAVQASITDAAGNTGSAIQALTVDTGLPVVTITGGATALTNDSTPAISGTTDAAVGSTVTVVLAGQTLAGTVQVGGTWSVSASTLTSGSYDVLASVTDPSGNTGSATQALTVDLVAPVITILGGAAATTSDSTPTIAGTTDAGTGSFVTVTVAGQSLTATVQSGGGWSLIAAGLADGTHEVVASVSDAAGNPASATQTLTVDTLAPLVTITGGPTQATGDSTPTISGTTDAPVGTTVTVTVSGQTLTGTVEVGGSWSVSAGTLTDGSHDVLASVTDATGNTGTAAQVLTIDTGLPVMAITGGPTRSTNDSTPTIAGTTDATPGATVSVTVAGQSLTATVQSGGSWSVIAVTVVDGTYDVVASVTDVAGTGTASQVLTVDTLAPIIGITGGPSRSTNDPTPAISGTTDAPAGSAVTVIVNGQSLTAPVQGGGSWAVTAAALADGTFAVQASVTDSAGNTGNATQALTVDTGVPEIEITGGLARSTGDPTPTIAGTTDAAVGTTVTVTVSEQTLTTAVLTGGTWSVTAAALADGTYDVLATVTDPVGNTGMATQALTIDTALPVIVISGGSARSTDDSTPTVSGTTDAEIGSTVTVTVSGQTVTTTVQVAGTWAVTAGTVADGTHAVLASVTDASGTGTATQLLTVETGAPLILITGGAARSTNDSTPTIAGTTDAAAGSTVVVAVAGQSLTTTVQPGGTWSLTAATLSDGTHVVVATVTDARGEGSATQALTVSTRAPWIMIAGGPADSTNDPTPRIAGLTNAARGSTVTVTVSGQTLTATVLRLGVWSVTAARLPDGTHAVRASVTGVGGRGADTQALTVDTAAPRVTIDGGGAASTNDPTPTISGTVDADAVTTTAAPRASVTVLVAGQRLTAVVRSGGAWSVTAAAVPDGTYALLAFITDTTGNIGSATQALTVNTRAPVAGPPSPAAGPTPPAAGPGRPAAGPGQPAAGLGQPAAGPGSRGSAPTPSGLASTGFSLPSPLLGTGVLLLLAGGLLLAAGRRRSARAPGLAEAG